MQHAPLTGLLLLFLLLTACLGGGEEAGQDTAVSPEIAFPVAGTLVCSGSCQSQGQCGTTADGRTVILAHSSKASTRDHDTLFVNETAVELLQAEPHTVLDSSGNSTNLNFYIVQTVGGGPRSYVAGTCVATQ